MFVNIVINDFKIYERISMYNKPDTVKLCIKIKDVSYVVGVLSFNKKKEELTYRLTYSSTALFEQEKYDQQGTLLNTKEKRLDHVTWHKGVMQIKTVNLNDREERIDQIVNYHKFSDQKVCPIYVECLKIDERLPLLPREEEYQEFKDSKTAQILSIDHRLEFSLVFIVINSDITTNDVMQHSYIEDLRVENILDCSSKIGRIKDIWNGKDLIVVAINKIYKLDVNVEKLQNNIRFFNYQQPAISIIKLINS